MIQFINEYDAFPLHLEEARLRRWIQSVAADYGKKIGDITYIFCNDERILSVNKEFLQHDYYTDVITFDYSAGQTLAGDIFISLDTLKTNAELFGTSFENELLRIIIHGVLHLTGQADKTEEAHAEMTRKENAALAKL